ncbi:hypothetical protein HD806DRAFT_483779 [Xylariaceae sp. AK1471]|nr:hypothetical protein HD806DRAFT_483779 [Xylariaceae sp. AK1471]
MAQPSSVISRTMRSISLNKIQEIEKQRDRYESRKNEVLAAADEHRDNIRERITQLLHGVHKLCDADVARDHRIINIELWLQQSSYDTSIPFQMLQSYETLLRSKLEVESRKLSLGHLYSRLVTEWMNSSTPMSEETDSEDDESLVVVDHRKVHLQELCDRFEEVVFTPLETDEAKIEQYLQGLFSGDEANKALKSLRHSIDTHGWFLLKEKDPFNQSTLRWCVNGLLAEDLLSEEKQAILREFLGSPVILNEIADVLNIRFADFDNWSWQAGEQGIPVLPRPQLNGKYRMWMDEDVLQAIFIHYIGIKNCVALNNSLTRFSFIQDGIWKWKADGDISQVDIDRMRYEYFSGTTTAPVFTVDKTRAAFFQQSFFLSQLPSSVISIGKNRAYVNDGDAEESEEEKKEGLKAAENVNIKQNLLRTLASEAIVHRTLYGEAAVIQSDLQWYATGLSHSTIFAVMRFLGFSEALVSFYKKMLQAPLNMVSASGDSPTGEPRTRQRGVPMAHAPEKLIGEMILFIMDLAVNKATGMLLYRLHDDLFLCGQPSRCAQAWKVMEEFADVMGVKFNKSKTGSAYLIGPEKTRDAEIEATLPEGIVRIGHLLLDQESGEWLLDQDQIGEHVVQLRKQLTACNNILDWVKTWNSCIRRFFSHTLGEPAFCFGVKHVDSVLQMYQRIQKALFKPSSHSGEKDEHQQVTEGNVVDYLKSKIKERFGISNIPDAFIFLPKQLGGLGVNNPFIPYLAFRKGFHESESSPDKIMAEYFALEKENYRTAQRNFTWLDTQARLGRLHFLYPNPKRFEYAQEMLANVLVPGDGDDFFSFEEYISHSESNSSVLDKAYIRLLSLPAQEGPQADQPVIEELNRVGFKAWDNSQLLQVRWVVQLYYDELKEQFGGCRLVDEKHLPLGVLTMMRRKAVQWNMVL